MKLFAFLGAALLLAGVGCVPEDVPSASPDGSRVAVLLDDPANKDHVAVGILDVAGKQWKRHELPDKWSAIGLVWVGPRLLVHSKRPKEVAPTSKREPTHDLAWWLLDPASGECTRSEIDAILGAPFMADWKEKPCLFVQPLRKEGTEILSLPDLAKVATLDFRAEPVGHNRLLRVVDGKNGLMASVDVTDTDGKRICSIPKEELAKACYRDARVPKCGRVSSDGKHVVLGFDTETIFRQAETEYTYGVFRLSDGTLTWAGKSNALRGLPVMTDDAVYALEAKSRSIYTGERTIAAVGEGAPKRSEKTSRIVLARHRATGRDVLLELPLKPTDFANRYSVSTDRKSFLLQVEGSSPRLLVVPITDAVTPADVTEFPLPAQ